MFANEAVWVGPFLTSLIVGLVAGVLAYYLPIGKSIFFTANKIIKSGDSVLDMLDKRHGSLEVEIHFKRKGKLLRLDKRQATHRKGRKLCKWVEKNLKAQYQY